MLDRFYLIVDSTDWLLRLFPHGLNFVQLRLKDLPSYTLSSEIRKAVAISEKYGRTLVINDHWTQAIDAGAEYLHLGQEDLEETDLRAVRNAGIKIGISTHTEEELERALELDPDYVALGPIFEPRGKKVSYAPQGLSKIGIWKRRIACPLVAIGGITLQQSKDVFSAGADVICVITDVLNSDDPEERTRTWLDARKQWQHNQLLVRNVK